MNPDSLHCGDKIPIAPLEVRKVRLRGVSAVPQGA